MDAIENQSFYGSVMERILVDCIKDSVIVKHSDIKQLVGIDDKPELNSQPVINFDPKRVDKYVKKIVFIITKEVMLARQSEIIRILGTNAVNLITEILKVADGHQIKITLDDGDYEIVMKKLEDTTDQK